MVIGTVNNLAQSMSGFLNQPGKGNAKAGAHSDTAANNSSIKASPATIAQTEASKASKSISKTENGFLNKLLEFGSNSSSTSTNKLSFEDLKGRFADLRQKGALMRHHPVPAVVNDYMAEMKSILGALKDGNFEGNFKSNAFQNLEILDQELDKLSNDFVREQKSELELVASLGELEGLLVDVFV